jgi:hypothetical protein
MPHRTETAQDASCLIFITPVHVFHFEPSKTLQVVR